MRFSGKTGCGEKKRKQDTQVVLHRSLGKPSLFFAIVTRAQRRGLQFSRFRMIRRPEAEPFPRELGVVRCKFLYFDKLIFADVCEALLRFRSGPPNFQSHDRCRFAKADMLLDRIGSKRAAAANSPVNRAGLASVIFHDDPDARSDSRAI